jgi:hypothetical protein
VFVIGGRPRYQLRMHRRRKGEAEGVTWSDDQDLIFNEIWHWSPLARAPMTMPSLVGALARQTSSSCPPPS